MLRSLIVGVSLAASTLAIQPVSAQVGRFDQALKTAAAPITDVQYAPGYRYGPRGYYGGRGRYYGGRRGGFPVGAGIAAGLAAGALLGGAAIAAQGGPAYVEQPDPAGGADADEYCASRFRSYDPSSGTYMGYDGARHACP